MKGYKHTRDTEVIYSLSSFLVLVVIPYICFFCRTAWVQKIKAASELFIETEKKKREKAYLGISAFLSSV